MADNESIWARLTRLFRSGPVVRHKVAAGERNYEPQGTARAYKRELSNLYANSLASYGQYERLARYSDFAEMEYTPEIACIGIHSTINTPCGDYTVEELLEMQNGNDNFSFPVYCYDEGSERLAVGNAHSVRKTKTDTVFDVELDDGSKIRCTGDHLFLTRDGDWKQARELVAGQSLMPFYRESDKQKIGYNSVYTIASGWELEHRFVASQILGRPLKKYPEEVVHHRNLNKRDNSPTNLQVCSAEEHSKIHGREWTGAVDNERLLKIASKISAANSGRPSPFKGQTGLWNQTEEAKRKIGCSTRLLFDNEDYKKRAVSGILAWAKSDEGRAMMASITSERNRERWKTDVAYRQKMSGIFSAHAKSLHAQEGWTENVFMRRKNEVFASYSAEEKREKFGRAQEQNGMFKAEIQTAAVLSNGTKYSSLDEFITKEIELFSSFSSIRTRRQFVRRRLSLAGFKDWNDYKARYEHHNHKVISVVEVGVEDVYDITVDGHHNFACGGVIVHNSALNIFADETTCTNEQGELLKIVTPSDTIKEVLETFFFDVLNIEFNLWSWVRNLCKTGDFCLFVDASEQNGILNLLPIPINEIEREEGYDKNDPFAVRFRWLTQGNMILQNWQIIHFRLLGNDAFLPYGQSMIEPARRIWRQLILIEDAMMVYRIVRSPERRVFKIPVGNIAAEDVERYMEEIKNKLKRSQIIDASSGRVDQRYNPLSVDEDYFVPTRGGEGPTIETLPGGQFVGDIEDVQYIQNKLFSALQVPKAYLGYEADLGSKSTLSQMDVRFAKTIERIQKIVVAELEKIAIIHLYLLGYRGENLVNFKIEMANPSTIAEQQHLELWRMRFEVAGMAQEGIFDRETIYRDIFKRNDKQIAKIKEGKRFDALEDKGLEEIKTGAPDVAAGEDAAAGGGEAVPGEEALPTTLGGEPETQPEGAEIEGKILEYNPGSEGNDAFVATDKGKDLFSTGEDAHELVFGTDKQTASDPYDSRAQRRLVTRPFSEKTDLAESVLKMFSDKSPEENWIDASLAQVSRLDESLKLELSSLKKMIDIPKKSGRKRTAQRPF